MAADNVSNILEKKREKAKKKAEANKVDPYPFNTSVPKELLAVPEEKRNFLYYYATLNEFGKATQHFNFFKELERLNSNTNVIYRELQELKKKLEKTPQDEK